MRRTARWSDRDGRGLEHCVLERDETGLTLEGVVRGYPIVERYGARYSGSRPTPGRRTRRGPRSVSRSARSCTSSTDGEGRWTDAPRDEAIESLDGSPGRRHRRDARDQRVADRTTAAGVRPERRHRRGLRTVAERDRRRTSRPGARREQLYTDLSRARAAGTATRACSRGFVAGSATCRTRPSIALDYPDWGSGGWTARDRGGRVQTLAPRGRRRHPRHGYAPGVERTAISGTIDPSSRRTGSPPPTARA